MPRVGQKNALRHGHASNGVISAEYRAWSMMKNRCYSPTSPAFKYYGARGILVCNRWLDSFQNFFDDVGGRPGPGYSIDRYPNNNGNYEPGNVRWATWKEQMNNRRLNKMVKIDGIEKTVSEWADFAGVKNSSIFSKINSGGLKPIDAVKYFLNIIKSKPCIQ